MKKYLPATAYNFPSQTNKRLNKMINNKIET